ncbi:MAG: hypothetical protein CVU42_01665 [Chloroflexi bacterium HGW-Chloroflexi-4]|jgi:tetratricopeptide (TPR) repeat protein|nr:MAG: hypothetical protein CVU42_01665 [Chloroflexi bacterium HGW-Chloroflexi-4]
MTDHNESINNKSNDTNSNTPGSAPSIQSFTRISEDIEFIQFNECYQKGDLEQSESILLHLIDRYPDEVQLERYQQEIKMQRSLREMSLKHNQETHDKTIKKRLRTTVLFSGVSALAIIVFMVTAVIVFNFASKKISEQNDVQLGIMMSQVEQLLLSGQPVPASQVISKMEALDPEYHLLPDLQKRTNELLDLELKYKESLDFEKRQQYPEALSILIEIEDAKPGLWDIPVRIQSINNQILAQEYYQKAAAAYAVGDWNSVIENYEAALDITYELEDPIKKEQLLNGYLRSIINLLENDSVSIDEISKAEDYYRKAVAMIPQSTAFANERENLQEVSSNLLQLKFAQLARQMLEDPQQTVRSVSQAVSYLSKAKNLSPNNSELQNELINAQLYQIGFQNFVQLNWNPAIDNLKRLVDNDPLFANGNAALLLYDAYVSKGNQNYSVGLYLDARSNYEQAEILAWEDTKNPMKLFQVEYLLGNTIGKVGDYSNAITYYQFSLKPAYIYKQLMVSNEFYSQLPISENFETLINPELTYNQYFDAFSNVHLLFSNQVLEIKDGECLTFFAEENKSTTFAIQTANNLSKNVTVTFGQELKVPTLGN